MNTKEKLRSRIEAIQAIYDIKNLKFKYKLLKKKPLERGFKLSELDKSDKRIRKFTSCQKESPPFSNLI